MKKSDLIIHPVRFRLLRVIGNEQLTTQEMADQLPDVPKSSIYRHLKLLLEGDMVTVAETRPVNGIQEKVYKLVQPPSLSAADVAGLSAEEHTHYFAMYTLLLLRDFAAYVTAAAEQGGVDMLADYAGYREVRLYATPAEWMAAMESVSQALLPLIQNEPAHGRRTYKFATVVHPLASE